MELQLGCVVEGHGDVTAVPVLVRRVVERLAPGTVLRLPQPIRASRHSLIKQGELERAVALAAAKAGQRSGVLVVLDADDDCPAVLAPSLLKRARARLGDRPVAVVVAKREFEAWLIAGAASLAGKRGLSVPLGPPAEPESVRDAKGWLRAHMLPGRRYRETLDQEPLAAVVDLDAARTASSFDKLVRDLQSLVDALRARAEAERR